MIEDFKRASWLELFYDVAFVALVAQLTYLAYDHHHTVTDLYTIFLVGYTIFIAWWSTTANRNLQPTETGLDKFLFSYKWWWRFV
jgi:low temperature requirement protein LtrA